MVINFDKVSKYIKEMDIKEPITITSRTALAIYGINNQYIMEPYSILSDIDEPEDREKYSMAYFTDKVYEDDIFVVSGVKIVSPGKAMLDQLLSGAEGDMYELLDIIYNTSFELTLTMYIKKYRMQKIMKNIMKNYRLEEFSRILDINE